MGEESYRRWKVSPLIRWFPKSASQSNLAERDASATANDGLNPVRRSKEERHYWRLAGIIRLWLGVAQMAGAILAALLLWIPASPRLRSARPY